MYLKFATDIGILEKHMKLTTHTEYFVRSLSWLLEIESPRDRKEGNKKNIRACMKADFPQCLKRALVEIVGKNGRHELDSLVAESGFRNSTVTSTEDLRRLYVDYLARVEKRLGDAIPKMVEFETMNQMELMSCSGCPLHEAVIRRKHKLFANTNLFASQE